MSSEEEDDGGGIERGAVRLTTVCSNEKVAEIHLPEYDSRRSDPNQLERPLSVQSNESSVVIEQLKSDGRFDAFSTVTLSWKDIHVAADVNTGKSCIPNPRSKKNDNIKTRDILKQVSGVVEPGQFVAIMGASGAGKSTLLNTLAFRNDSKLEVSGEVCANGRAINKHQMSLISAYVQQEDYFIGTLTVKEVMMFHANLRMDKKLPVADKRAKVETILTKLGLAAVKDNLCGFPGGMIRGISGGERKRLSVATEMLMDPPLLFIDEPTSGLDSFMAESIVKLIGKLAKAKRTVLCTIHQPNSEVYTLFDRVCLVAEGNIVYLGTTQDALKHFEKIGLPCPNNYNPADHFIFSLAIRPGMEDLCRNKVKDIAGYYKESEDYKAIENQINEIVSRKEKKPKSYTKLQASLWDQMFQNLKRSFLNTVRNPGYTRMRIFQSLVFALLAGLAFFGTENNQEVAQNKSGVLFFLVVSLSFGNMFIHTQSIPQELPVIVREYQNGMYGATPYLLSRVITEIPWILAMPLLLVVISYFMIGLRLDFIAFLVTYAACIGVTWSATGLGMFIATWTGDVQIAGAVAAPIIMPFFLFGGLYQNDRSTPVYFLPVKWVSWFKYGFNMLMINELKDLEISCPVNTTCPFTNGTQILHQFGIDDFDLWWPNFVALWLIGAAFIVLSWSCLMCRVRR